MALKNLIKRHLVCLSMVLTIFSFLACGQKAETEDSSTKTYFSIFGIGTPTQCRYSLMADRGIAPTKEVIFKYSSTSTQYYRSTTGTNCGVEACKNALASCMQAHPRDGATKCRAVIPYQAKTCNMFTPEVDKA